MHNEFRKLLLILQFWNGDREQMVQLARLIYDLEPSFCKKADLVLLTRKDTKTHNPEEFDFLQDKFNVDRWISNRAVVGWPHGPNAMAMYAFGRTHAMLTEGRFNYDAAMLVEADCVPLQTNWIEALWNEWSQQSGLVLGHWDGSGTEFWAPRSHMNGNLLFHPELVTHVPDLKGIELPRGGWDMRFWPQICKYATPSRLIYSDYRLNTRKNPLKNCCHLFEPRVHTYPTNPLVGQKLYPCWLHGTKGDEAITCVREQLL